MTLNAALSVASAGLLILTGCEEPVDRGLLTTPAGHALVWAPDRLPVRLQFDPHLAGWVAPFRRSAAFYEREIGQALVIVPATPWIKQEIEADTVAVQACPSDAWGCSARNPQTRLHWFPDGQVYSADISLPADLILDDSGRYRVAQHELGHLLGLDHDTVRDSVMHYRLRTLLDAGSRLRLTSADRERLRARYAICDGGDG